MNFILLWFLFFGIFPSPAAEAFAVKNATGFHRLWSALNFLFCIVDGAGETAASAQVGFVSHCLASVGMLYDANTPSQM